MRITRLTNSLPEEEVAKLAATYLDDSHYDHVVTGDEDVYKPDGSLLLAYRKDAIPRSLCESAYGAMSHIDFTAGSGNRGHAGGTVSVDDLRDLVPSHRDAPVIDGTRYRPLKEDGTVSKTNYAKKSPSKIIGYFDRYPRIPYCRMTSFNLDHYPEFERFRPYAVHIDKLFAENIPARHAAQMGMIEQTSPDFFIRGTSFTTVTVNKNWQTAVHQDAGDLKEGFGVMSVLEGGRYSGGILIFPAYRVGVDMRTGGVCFADVHEWHGNTVLRGKIGQFVRFSCVFYYRSGMHVCGSAPEELARAKKYGAKGVKKRIDQQ